MSTKFSNPQDLDIEVEDRVDRNVPRELTRMIPAEEQHDRQRIRRIFDRFDRDRDGKLNIREIKRSIRHHECESMPKGVADRIMKMSDRNGDGFLDFEEFYQLSIEKPFLFQDVVEKYCSYVVPKRDRNHNTGVAGAAAYASHSRMQENNYDSVDKSYEDTMSCWPPPLTMIIFSILEVIAFVVDIVALRDYNGTIETTGTNTNGPAATLFIYDPRRRQQAWRFGTYMFVHVGVMHILMNLLVQLFLGVALELVHHWWRVSLVYLAGVVAGSMGTSLANPQIYLAGASGGVYALITAHLATIILNWGEMTTPVPQIHLGLILSFISADLGSSIYRHLTDPYDNVGYIAHLSGAIAGLLVGIGVLRNLNIRPWEKKLWWFAVSLFVGLMMVGVCIHIFIPSYFRLPPLTKPVYDP